MPYSTPSTSSSRTATSLYQANLFDIYRKNPLVEPQDRLSDIDSEDEPPSHPSTPPRPLLVVDTALSPQSQSSFPVNQIPKACPAHPSSAVLRDGKPLKSSFKRRLSFPPALPPRPAVHRRASDPSPPPFEREPTASPKAVHFRESKLETVCFFRETAKPSALLTRSPPPPTPCYVINTAGSDPIPNPSPASQGVVIIEDVHMEEMTMKGSIVVRNYAYEKAVAVLFTMDDWQTRSEVVARYSASLPSTEGEWDRFDFSIHLDHQALSLASRTMYLAARFSAAGGEWWDNNCGKNYCIRFSQVNDLPPSPLECQLDSPSNCRRHSRKKCGEATNPLPALQVNWTPYTASLVPPLSYSSDDDDGDDSSPVTPEPLWRERYPSRDSSPKSLPLSSDSFSSGLLI